MARKSILSQQFFYDEAAAFTHVESVLWPSGPVCPKCGGVDNATPLKVGETKRVKKSKGEIVRDATGEPVMVTYPARHGLWKCKNKECRAQFTVRQGTLFEESRLPMTKWLQAIHLMAASKKGVSSHQLSRVLECDYKSAWFLSHRIRAAMTGKPGALLGGAGKIVEADETYFGEVANPSATRKDGKPFLADTPNKLVRRGGRGPANKRVVISLVERGGSARTFHVERANHETVAKIIRENVDPASRLHTDEAHVYKAVGREMAAHETVQHSKDEYVRGDVTSNSVEGFFSIFKRGMRGVYQHCSEKHLHRYVAEFDFRYSNRVALGVDDTTRARLAMQGFKGKRLTYRGTDSAVA